MKKKINFKNRRSKINTLFSNNHFGNKGYHNKYLN